MLWVIVGLVALGAVALVARSVLRRRRADAKAVKDAARVDPDDTAALAALPLEVLDERARQSLVEVDNAIRTSADELEWATGELGPVRAKPFVDAVERAKAASATAFTIRQRLDDSVPETPEQRRDLLIEVIRACGSADAELDARVAEFDGVRDLLIEAPARLDALTQRQVTTDVRIPASRAILDKLRAEFPASVLAPVERNADLAAEQLAIAVRGIDEGRAAAALPVGQQAPVVDAIRTAEAALTQAAALLDAVDHAADNIRAAGAGLPAAIADLRGDVQRATALGAHASPELTTARQAAEAAITHAEARAAADPLGSMQAVTAADAALGTVLAAALDAKDEHDRAQARLRQDVDRAAAVIQAANDYVNTRRGAVGSAARTRLAEAERHLQAARQFTTSDPVRAQQHATGADRYAATALSEAQADVARWDAQRGGGSGGSGGSGGLGFDAGVLTGVLLDGVFGGSGRSRRSSGGVGGGFGGSRGGSRGGGRSGSFGGSRSSGRTRGGRF